MTAPRFLTIHCAATPEGRAVSVAQMNAIAMSKFRQRSYHWIVTIDGVAHRNLADTQRGAHVGRNNTGNIGICYVGGVATDGRTPKDTRTPAQRAALRQLVADYRAQYPGIIVRGHRDWPGVAKACPSFDVATAL
jgi:N-acetyl-anhydromuramyl-L-alanine amidase AmpD